MKKFTFLLVAVLIAGAAFSQTNLSNSDEITKAEAKVFINETNIVIATTGDLVFKRKVYTGGVIKSKEMQKRAIALYKNGHFQKAVNKSYKARRCAFIAHNANSDKPVPKKWRLTEAEKKMVTITVTKEEIEKIIKPEKEKEKKDNSLKNPINDVN